MKNTKLNKKLLSKNARYVFVCLLIIALLVFFFSSRAWIGDDRKNQTYNYDRTLTMSNSWYAKINNAVYDSTTKTLTVDFYTKERMEGQAERPVVSYVTLGNSQGPRLDFELLDQPSNIFGSTIIIHNVSSDWYYIRIYLSCKRVDTQKEPTIDEFGNTVTYPVVTGKKDTAFVAIDHRTALWKPSETVTSTAPTT